MSTMILRYCGYCGSQFSAKASKVKAGGGLFCNKSCSAFARSKRGPVPPEQRFWPKVAVSEGCWLWTAGKADTGYGMFAITKETIVGAHRYSFALTYGPIPDGLEVCHRCDVRACVRPDHLFVGDHDANMLDMAIKGRSGQRVLTPVQVLLIVDKKKDGASHGQLAEEFGVSLSSIKDIVSGRNWFWLTSGASQIPRALARR